ncbi:hypothetical protein M422DRAFT_255644 [Sphaerobolus stellatus SS14]|uniref:Uncharacterized protein n=1 Tax=Sphaerobolus stellatus (strain SS14) TaxID=990650 RepID=A0A0C9VIV1_SPHS4|nr:hypothetical protein M422DRAFT_255644 [Sphaerobolus stellatus SS14]
MSALREEINKKLHSDADSVTTVSHSMTTLDANAQYWSNLSNKAVHHSCRALELQLKMAEEKVNTLLYKEGPEEALLEVAQEAHNIHFQLDQNTHLHEAGLMPEQQVRFRTDPGGSVNHPSREYGVNTIHEAHIAWQEADAPLSQQSTPALSMTAQLDSAVVNRTSEYSGIQQMVRQAIQNASHEAEPGKSFLAKASVKMGNPPTYSGECNLKKFENWVVSVLRFMSMYNLLGPRVGKVQLQFLGQCLTYEAQEWFYWQVEQFDQEIKHWDLESIIMGLQKWFMPTLLMNKVAVNYDTIMQGSMAVQQLHQELLRLAKQIIELQTYQVLRKGFTPEFSSIDELIDEAVMFDNERRVAGARIEEVILEESDNDAPHPEEQQDWEDQPEDDQQYYFNDDEYKTRSIDNEDVRVNAVIKDSGYNDCCRLYGIRVWEAETDLRVSAVVQTEGKEQPIYNHQARKKA